MFKRGERCVEDEIGNVGSMGREVASSISWKFSALTPVSHRPTENCHSEICLADELRPEFLHCSLPSGHLWKVVPFSFDDGQPLQFSHTKRAHGQPYSGPALRLLTIRGGYAAPLSGTGMCSATQERAGTTETQLVPLLPLLPSAIESSYGKGFNGGLGAVRNDFLKFR